MLKSVRPAKGQFSEKQAE